MRPCGGHEKDLNQVQVGRGQLVLFRTRTEEVQCLWCPHKSRELIGIFDEPHILKLLLWIWMQEKLGLDTDLVVMLELISNSEWFLFPLTLSYNMLWTWRTYHETLPYSIYWNVVSGGIWWRRRDGVWRRRNPEIRNWDELCETKRNVLNMKFYFWLTFIASDHLASGQGGRYRPLLNRAYQNLQREAAKPPPPPPPHNPNYRHGNSYTHNTARKLLFYRPVIWLSIEMEPVRGNWIETKWPLMSWPLDLSLTVKLWPLHLNLNHRI